MLGLSSSLISGAAALKSIVRSGLQLFYKADKTQAPLGEEQLRNSSFDELGPDKIDNGNFETGIDGWSPNVGSEATITYNSQLKGIKFSNYGPVGSPTVRNTNSDTVTGETYKLTYKVLENNNASKISIWNGNTYSVYDDLPVNVSDDEHVYYYTFSGGDAPDLYIKLETDESDITLSNIKLEKVDPNNRWTLGTGWVFSDNGTITHTGSTGNFESSRQLVTGRKYEATVVVDSIADVSCNLYNSSNSETYNYTITTAGTHVRQFTATHATSKIALRTASTNLVVSSFSVKEITNSIKDHSKNSNDGILYSGKALALDPDTGALDYVSLKPSNEIGITSAGFTFAIWFKADSTQPNGPDDRIFSSRRNSGSSYFSVGLGDNGHLRVHLRESGTSLPATYVQTNYRDDKWHRVVVSASPTAQYIYVDNELVGTATRTLGSDPSSDAARLGTSPSPGVGNSLKCNLADLQTYDKAWNATDVKYDWENPDKDVFDRVGEAQVLGEEEVVNGDFANGTTGWTPATADTFEVIDGGTGHSTSLHIEVSAINRGAYQSVFVAGKTYHVSLDLKVVSGSVYIGKNTRKLNNQDYNNSDWQTITGTLTAIDDKIRIYGNNSSSEFYIDNISVKQVTTHASHILPTDCKSLLRLNEGAGDIVYDAAPVLRDEEVVDGDFPTGTTAWDLLNGATISDNKANIIGDGSLFTSIKQTGVFENGKFYQVVVDVTITSGLGLKFQDGANNENIGSATETGVYTFNFTGTSDADLVVGRRTSGTAFNSNVNSISVKEIKPSESFFISGDKNFLHQQPYIPQYAMSSFSKKMLFDGVNDYVTGSFNGNIGPAKDVTFSCWFSYRDSVVSSSDRETLFGLLSSSSDGNPFSKLEVGIFETNRIIVYTGDGTNYSQSVSGVNSLSNNKLNHVAVSLSSNGALKIYINGVESANVTHSNYGATTITHYRIGSRSNSINLSKGIIDEVSLFKSELTQAEVLELYNSGSSFDSTGHSKYNLGEEVSNSTFELGSEEVVDGDFSDGTTSGWTFENLTPDISNNTLKLTSTTATNNKAYYDISTEVGKTYQMSADVKSGATNSISGIGAIGVTTPLSFKDGANADSFTTLKFVFIATLETTQIRLLNSKAGTWGGLGSIVEFDNISVKEVLNWELRPGLSVNNNTIIYDGTGSQYARIIQTLSTVVGRTYQMTFTLSGLSSGDTVNFGLGRNGSFSGYTQQTYSSNGTYTRIMQAQSTDDDIMVQINQADANCTVSNISVQEYGLSGYWRNNGADQWDDLSINSNHGTVSGSPTEIFLQEVPFFGKDSLGMFMNKPRLGGLNLNGSGYVNGGNDSTIKPTSALSVECWIRTPDVSVTSKYISDAESGATRFFLMQVGSKARFSIAGTDRDSAANLTNNTWHYIAGTWDGSTMTLYVDERTPVAVSKSGSISYDTDDLYIGTRLGTGEFYDGIIDDVKLYNKALTPAEIKRNYNATKGKHKN